MNYVLRGLLSECGAAALRYEKWGTNSKPEEKQRERRNDKKNFYCHRSEDARRFCYSTSLAKNRPHFIKICANSDVANLCFLQKQIYGHFTASRYRPHPITYRATANDHLIYMEMDVLHNNYNNLSPRDSEVVQKVCHPTAGIPLERREIKISPTVKRWDRQR